MSMGAVACGTIASCGDDDSDVMTSMCSMLVDVSDGGGGDAGRDTNGV